MHGSYIFDGEWVLWVLVGIWVRKWESLEG